MPLAETSLIAHREYVSSGAASRQAKRLLEAMQDGRDYSRRELALMAGIELCSVCGLVNKLVRIGVLVELPARNCKVTGRTVNPVAKPSENLKVGPAAPTARDAINRLFDGA